jgi:cytochrome c biogenesis protein ResB
MVQYIPMIILMAMFGAIGLYWAIGTRHFISWSRKFKNSFPKFSDDNSVTTGQNGAVCVKAESGVMLKWGVRLVGIALAAVAVGTIVDMFLHG